MNLFNELKRRNVIRVALFYIVSAWVVIQVAETVLPMFDVADGALRAIVIVLALGFVPVVLFAWAFEMTPDGLKLDKNAYADPASRLQTEHKLNWATLIAALLAIGLLIADRMLPEAPTMRAGQISVDANSPADSALEKGSDAPDPASIAVLPLAIRSGCERLYSEDLGHGQQLGSLTVIPQSLISDNGWRMLTCDKHVSARPMTHMIQIRNVPTALHRALKARAAIEGKSMSELLLEQMEAWLELPSELELRERLRNAEPFDMAESSAEVIRKERDAA